MNRLSALDAFSPAMARVSAMLFKPFRLGIWLKMGFIGLLGGGVARFSSGNLNFRGPMFPPSRTPSGRMPDDPFAELRLYSCDRHRPGDCRGDLADLPLFVLPFSLRAF
jgi:hypothetical protein